MFCISKICPYAKRIFFSSLISRFITFNSEAASRKRVLVYFLQGVCPPGGRPACKCGALKCSRFFRDGVKFSFKHGVHRQDHPRTHPVHMLDLQWLKLGFSHMWMGIGWGDSCSLSQGHYLWGAMVT